MILLNGKATAAAIRQKLTQQVSVFQNSTGRVPHLAIILIGSDPASHTYVNAKLKACQEVGFKATLMQYAAIQESTLLHYIEQVNQDTMIDGLIVQLPLPPHISVQKVIHHIKPEKDVDGFHTLNYGRMACNLPSHVPATPLGITTLLAHYQIKTSGKHCVIIGRSRIVGAPLSILMSRDSYPGNATVTLCHSHTQYLRELTCQADILVVATGQPRFVTADMVKKGAVVIDVGLTSVTDLSRKSGYRLQGDVDFDQVAPHCSYISPVPGGVGPMTISALLSNTLRAAVHHIQQSPQRAE